MYGKGAVESNFSSAFSVCNGVGTPEGYEFNCSGNAVIIT